jgi:hypothetical protein
LLVGRFCEKKGWSGAKMVCVIYLKILADLWNVLEEAKHQI